MSSVKSRSFSLGLNVLKLQIWQMDIPHYILATYNLAIIMS